MGRREDWRPTATIDALRARARLIAHIRAFFAERDVLEVETPILSAAASTDLHLDSFATPFGLPGRPGSMRYLHTSPEFAMKRLLAAGAGPIYQITKAFRNGECGRLHNPEFTLLEWYRPGFDHHQLMNEVEALVRLVMGAAAPRETSERLTYRDAFIRHVGVDPHTTATATLLAAAARHNLDITSLDAHDQDACLDLLLTHLVEPHLGRGRLTFLYDYPASQAALARLAGDPPVAERFELYLEGIELANGFHELVDAQAQRTRFLSDLAARRAHHLAIVPLDERLIAALEAGMPSSAGVALGVDRLVMLCLGKRSVSEVIAFGWDDA